VFAAQVIQEDEEPLIIMSHDAHEIHEQESNGWEETPIPEETKEAPEHSVDLNMILGTMSSHSTHSMNTSKSKRATGIATLSISARLEK
jgi:hypothetical protein